MYTSSVKNSFYKGLITISIHMVISIRFDQLMKPISNFVCIPSHWSNKAIINENANWILKPVQLHDQQIFVFTDQFIPNCQSEELLQCVWKYSREPNLMHSHAGICEVIFIAIKLTALFRTKHPRWFSFHWNELRFEIMHWSSSIFSNGNDNLFELKIEIFTGSQKYPN